MFAEEICFVFFTILLKFSQIYLATKVGRTVLRNICVVYILSLGVSVSSGSLCKTGLKHDSRNVLYAHQCKRNVLHMQIHLLK